MKSVRCWLVMKSGGRGKLGAVGETSKQFEVGAHLAGGVERRAGVSAGLRGDGGEAGRGKLKERSKRSEEGCAVVAGNHPASASRDKALANALGGVSHGGEAVSLGLDEKVGQ